MGKEWDTFAKKPRRIVGTRNREYQSWCEEWAREVYRVLKPGAYMLAFGGTRTYHRMACAIEDAGFEVRDTLMWLYGSGFPKNHDVSKGIDKAAGAERDVISRGAAVKRMIPGADQNQNGWVKDNGHEFIPEVTVPAPPPEAAQWAGWGTALKPAVEPIILARKPLIGTVVANVLKHGTGALNIDACRVEGQPETTRFDPAKHNHEGYRMTATGADCAANASPAGRWPANVAHDGSDEVLEAFAAFGESKSSDQPRYNGEFKSVAKGHDAAHTTFGHTDSGTAARFFYSSKADKADRADSRHPTIKPVDLMRWLVRLVTPASGIVLDCFAGSGTTGEAAMLEGFDCTLIESDPQSVADIEHRIRRWSGLDGALFSQ